MALIQLRIKHILEIEMGLTMIFVRTQYGPDKVLYIQIIHWIQKQIMIPSLMPIPDFKQIPR